MEEIQEGEPLPHPKKSVFRSRRLAGVEWEFNSASDYAPIRRWAEKWGCGIHHDGSCGWEAVTAPMSGDNIEWVLSDLSDAFDAGRALADDRCGLHVHIDGSDLRWSDIYRLLWVYDRIEPVLYVLAGHKRVENSYAVPCGSLYRKALANVDRKGAVIAVAVTQNGDTIPSPEQMRRNVRTRGINKKAYGRYKGLNLAPWLAARKYKRPDQTIEFRMHRNTLDAERVIEWTKLLVRLVDWVSNATDKEAQSLPKSSLRALCMIAPDSAPWIMQRVKAWRTSTTVRTYGAMRGRRTIRRVRFLDGNFVIPNVA